MKKNTTHHLVPRSRCRELRLNGNQKGNTAIVPNNKHEAWHILFGNMTPEEIILHIIDCWFPRFGVYSQKVQNDHIYFLYQERRGSG